MPVLLKLPLVPLIVPENNVEALLPPEVKSAVPITICPAPAIDPTISFKLFKSKVAPDEILTALTLLIALLLFNVPVLIFVAPEYVLPPANVNSPAPSFSTMPVPLITPAYACALDRLNTTVASLITPPVATSDPPVAPLPICRTPASTTVPPVYVFSPAYISEPVPDFVTMAPVP